MASLFRRPGSDHWWIRYTKDGRQIRTSTGTDDKNKALLQLREIELLLGQCKASGSISQKLAEAIPQESVRPMPISTVLEDCRRHVGDKTGEVYKSRDNFFMAWLRRNHPGVTLMSEIDRPMVKSFLGEIADTFSARTHNGYLRRLRSVSRCAVRDGFAAVDATKDLEFMPESGSNRRAFTEEELRKFFASLTGEVRLLATLGLYAGAMRLSDIIGLTWGNIDLRKDTIHWRMSKRHGKPMEIAIHPRLRKEIDDIPGGKRGEPVLPRFHNSPDRASEAFRKALVNAGLKIDNRPAINRRHAQRKRERAIVEHEGRQYVPEPVRRRKDELDFHSLRYNFVSILKSQGCPEAIARSIMGHSSVEVSAIYTQIDAESERKWVAALPDVVANT